MAYDVQLAERIRVLVGDVPGVSEQKMFGGLAFLVEGNMAVAASGQGGLLVRADPHDFELLTADADAEPMVMRGRPMTGWLRVDSTRVNGAADLERWVAVGIGYARTLPAKPAPRAEAP